MGELTLNEYKKLLRQAAILAYKDFVEDQMLQTSRPAVEPSRSQRFPQDSGVFDKVVSLLSDKLYQTACATESYLKSLPERYYMLVKLRYFDGFSWPDVAKQAKLSISEAIKFTNYVVESMFDYVAKKVGHTQEVVGGVPDANPPSGQCSQSR